MGEGAREFEVEDEEYACDCWEGLEVLIRDGIVLCGCLRFGVRSLRRLIWRFVGCRCVDRKRPLCSEPHSASC